MPPVPACDTCKFWTQIPPTPQHPNCGECHRYAPSPIVGESSRDAEVTVNHPITHNDHWCGDYVKK